MTNNTIHTNTGTYGVNDATAVGPLMQGQAGVVMTFTLTDLGGTVVNLTGLTITGTITNTQTKATAALAGAIALVTPASGVFSWTTHEDDVGTAGEFLLTFKSSTSLITLPAYLSILETPAASTTFGAALVGVTVAEAAWLTLALATMADAADLANVPDPAGATDGYVWTADGADGAGWEAAAGGVTDHGALTGLSDDDHTGYALLAGRAGGQTLYGGDAANDDITIHGTSDATRTTSYVLLQPTAGNVGIGTTAPGTLLHGLLTSAATSAVTNVLTIGHDTSGTAAAGFGAGLLYQLESSTTAAQDAARIAALWTDATHATRASALTFSTLTAGGSLAERMRIDGEGNVGIGTADLTVPGGTTKASLRVVSTSAYPVSFEGSSTYAGFGIRSIGVSSTPFIQILRDTTAVLTITVATDNDTIAFRAGNAVAASILTMRYATQRVGIGTTAPATLLHGLLTSAATNAVTNVVTIGHDTSGTAANGFGAGQLFTLESSTTAAQSAARIQALWNDATHATRKADLVLTAYDTAEREGLRIRGNGSAAAIGFLGATPAARVAHVADPSGGATVDAEARSAINAILATLETFGFHATS